MTHPSKTVTPVCPGCGHPVSGRRRTCSDRCRWRLKRQVDAEVYEVTAEDRAAIRRAAQLVPIPVPLPTAEQVEAIVAAHAAQGAVADVGDLEGAG